MKGDKLDVIIDYLQQHHAMLSRLETDVAGLKTDVSELKHNVGVLQSDVAGLKTDVAGLKTDVADLKTSFVLLEKRVDNIEIKLDRLCGEMELVKERQIFSDQRIQEIDSKLKTILDNGSYAKFRFSVGYALFNMAIAAGTAAFVSSMTK